MGGHVLKLGITQEFGTRPPIAVFGATRALNAKLSTHPNLPIDAPEREASLDAFYPRTPSEKVSILTRGRDVLDRFWAATVLPEEEVLQRGGQ